MVAGQAYHWFDPSRAHAEVAQVLRPGGTFAAIWNERDENVRWVADLSALAEQILSGSGVRTHRRRPDSFGAEFTPLERREFRHVTRHTADTLLGMVATRSYYLTAGPRQRKEMDDAVRHLVATHPDLAGRADFELPYVTRVYRARRR